MFSTSALLGVPRRRLCLSAGVCARMYTRVCVVCVCACECAHVSMPAAASLPGGRVLDTGTCTAHGETHTVHKPSTAPVIQDRRGCSTHLRIAISCAFLITFFSFSPSSHTTCRQQIQGVLLIGRGNARAFGWASVLRVRLLHMQAACELPAHSATKTRA